MREMIMEPGDPVYAACMPVDNEANRRKMPGMFSVELLAEAGLPPDGLTRPVYKDSVQGDCETCLARVWIGPKIAGAKAINPNVCVVCMLCAVKAGELHGSIELQPLSTKVFGD